MITGLIVLIMFGATACGNTNKTLTLDEMLTSYKKHPFRSDFRYRYRRINLTGTVHSLDCFDSLKKGDDTFTIKITKDSYIDILDFAFCEFPKEDAEEVMKLKPGDPVTIQGMVAGYRFFLMLSDCQLLKVPDKNNKP